MAVKVCIVVHLGVFSNLRKFEVDNEEKSHSKYIHFQKKINNGSSYDFER